MIYIKVLAGPMGCGKTEELIRQMRIAKIAKQRVIAIIPDIDTRSQAFLATREENEHGSFVPIPKLPAFPIDAENGKKQLKLLFEEQEPDLVIVDEGQFFKKWFFNYLLSLSLRKDIEMRILIAVVERDAWGNPFGYAPQYMAIANEVIKLTAVCLQCRKEGASLTQKKEVGSGQQIEVGYAQYEARCVNCWTPPPEQ